MPRRRTWLFRRLLGTTSVLLMAIWLIAVWFRRFAPSVELFPLIALISGLVEIGSKSHLVSQ
jgi:uncharacterized membrane-anchored protein